MKHLLGIFIFLFSINVDGQNLVRNPSFENYTICPNSPQDIGYADYWSEFSLGIPDYFNFCAPSCHSTSCPGIPGNFSGDCFPYDGQAYAGVIMMYFIMAMSGPPFFASGVHSILGVNLTNQLIPNHKYFVSAYVHRGTGITGTGGTGGPFPLSSVGACNNFGFRFFTSQHDQNNPVPIDNFAHIRDTSIIQDTAWHKVVGSFIADSAYNYLAMGNFFSDSLTDTLNLKNYVNQPGDINAVYYYVDYVCVSEDSLWQATTGLRPDELKEEFSIYPNPASNHLRIENIKLNSTITIFNFLGEKLKQMQSEGFSLDIDIEKFKPGIYFIQTSYGLTRKFIKL